MYTFILNEFSVKLRMALANLIVVFGSKKCITFSESQINLLEEREEKRKQGKRKRNFK